MVSLRTWQLSIAMHSKLISIVKSNINLTFNEH